MASGRPVEKYLGHFSRLSAGNCNTVPGGVVERVIRESKIEMAKRGERSKKKEQRGKMREAENNTLMSSCPHMHLGCKGSKPNYVNYLPYRTYAHFGTTNERSI